MSFAKLKNIKIYYEIYGEDNDHPVILIHGFGGNRTEWTAQIGALSEKFKAILFDNRGAGKSDRPNIPYTMEIYSDDIAGLMAFLKINKAHIIGASLGGMIAQNFVLKYPEKVNKLVLINTFPGFPNQQALELFKNGLINKYHAKLKDPTKTFFNTAKNGFTRNFIKLMKEDPKRRFYNIFSAEDIIQNSITDLVKPQDIENAAKAISKHNVINRLHEIKNPTLVLCAEKDRISPKIINQKIHDKIPNSSFQVIKDAGHDSKLEKALVINKAILDFLF